MTQAATLHCPFCRQAVDFYCTLNDRVAACEPCARNFTTRLLELTPQKVFGGLGLAFLASIGAGVVWGAIIAATEGPPLGWVISAILIGIATGKGARRGSGNRGGLVFQVAAVIFALVAWTYATLPLVWLQLEKQHGPHEPVAMIVASVIGPPIFVAAFIAANPWLILALVYGGWNAAQQSALAKVVIAGPFPVARTGAAREVMGSVVQPATPSPATPSPANSSPTTSSPPPAPGAVPPSDVARVRPIAPPPAAEARAAGLDFERPQ